MAVMRLFSGGARKHRIKRCDRSANPRLSIANQNSRPPAILRCRFGPTGAASPQPVRGTPMKAGQGARFQGSKEKRHDRHARC